MTAVSRLEPNVPSSSLAGSPAPTSSRPASSTAFERRLLAYALGSGAVAFSSAIAEAEVIWSGIQNIDVSSTGVGNASTVDGLHVNVNDITSPAFDFGWGSSSGFWGVQLRGYATPGNAVEFGKSSSLKYYLQNNGSGALIPAVGLSSDVSGFAATYDATNGDWVNGDWPAGGTGYVGFVFQDLAASNYYGWMEVDVPTDGTTGQNARLVQWAFESSPNTPIAAGSTVSAVPEVAPEGIATAAAALVAGLGLIEQAGFASGARGLRAWRRRRQPTA